VEWAETAFAVTLTPLANANGSTTVHFSLTDGLATEPLISQFSQIGFDVPLPPSSPTNTPPFVGGVPNQTIQKDSDAVTVTLNIGDLESPANILTVSAWAGDSSLIPDSNLSVGGSGATRTLTIRPNPNRSGTTEIDVTVSDGELSTTESFAVTIAPQMPADGQLRFLSIGRAPGGSGMKLTWSAVPDQTYQVLAKDRVDQGYWTIVSSKIMASGTNITWTDLTSASSARFYLVRKLLAQPSPRIIAISPNRDGEMIIEWSSQPGATYRVVAKNGLDPNVWWPASEVLVATRQTTTWTDVDARLFPVRFYRVEWIP
jgi:hypothetical protein